MAHITKANFFKLLKLAFNFEKIVPMEKPFQEPIYFFNDHEKKYLLVAKELLKKGNEFFKNQKKGTILTMSSDNKIFQGNKFFAYHKEEHCERLNADYRNYEIPAELIERFKSQSADNAEFEKRKNEFRAWFKLKLDVFKNDVDQFVKDLEIRYNIIQTPKEILYENSGHIDLTQLNLGDLETQISKLIHQSKMYFVENPEEQKLIRRFQKLTFLAYTSNQIKTNDTNLSDDELRVFLKKYDDTFKKPLKSLLIQYYIVKYNPNLCFEEGILEELGFRKCSCCYNAYINIDESQNELTKFKKAS